jgi:hypothetical protein
VACRCPLIHRAIPRETLGGFHDVFQAEANRQHHFRVNAVGGTDFIACGGVPVASAHAARDAHAKSAMSRAERGRRREGQSFAAKASCRDKRASLVGFQ